LFFSLDALSHNPNVHLFRGADKALNDGYAHPGKFEVVEQQFVDLDDIDGHREQLRQRRKARPEIVGRYTYATSS
jgi:hypothetical protein